MRSPKVSVIVAAYNAEITLSRCLDSIIAQSLSEFEVVLVDDGSTDSTGEICDFYSTLDSRIKTYHKNNEGIGTTRQFGNDHANGDFTIHVDADDWVEPDYLELLYNKAIETNAEMVICDLLEEKKYNTILNQQEPKITNGRTFPMEFFRLHGSPCNKLIKRSSYQSHNIRYLDGIRYGEDKIFNIQLAQTGITIAYIPKALYHYDMTANPNSAVHSCSLAQIQNRDNYVAALRSLFPDNEYKEAIDVIHLGNVYFTLLSKAFTKTQFKKKYASLLGIKWKSYKGLGFPINIITWTSLHFSYHLSLLMSDFKQFVRHHKEYFYQQNYLYLRQ